MKTVLLSLSVLFLGFLLLAAAAPQNAPSGPTAQTPAPQPEKHLRNTRQLTFGGQNAEAYFSADGKKLIFQSTREPREVRPDLHHEHRRQRSAHGLDRQGPHHLLVLRIPDGKKILYASTHLGSPDCPPKPDYSKGYVWAIYPSFDIFTANPDGYRSEATHQSPATTPRPRSPPTARRSSSPPFATATSTFTPWTPTART